MLQREKVKINLKAQTADAKPAFGSFSVAVVDETKVPFDEDNESTILSNLVTYVGYKRLCGKT